MLQTESLPHGALVLGVTDHRLPVKSRAGGESAMETKRIGLGSGEPGVA